MKKLIVSMRSTDDMFADFKKVTKNIKKGKVKEAHYKISFENKKDFTKFVRNISLLMVIMNFRPHSIYQLAKIAIDLSYELRRYLDRPRYLVVDT